MLNACSNTKHKEEKKKDKGCVTNFFFCPKIELELFYNLNSMKNHWYNELAFRWLPTQWFHPLPYPKRKFIK